MIIEFLIRVEISSEMEMIGMRNTCIVITRHYKGKMFGARWSIMQSQMCKIARMMKYEVPSNMNIHKFFPTLEGDSYRKQYGSHTNNNSYSYSSDNARMTSNQRDMLQWQQMVFNKLATQMPQMYQPPHGYAW